MIESIDERVGLLVREPWAGTITSDDDHREAGAYLVRAKTVLDWCESLYAPLIRGLRATITAHQAEAKTKVAPLEARIRAVRSAMIEYHTIAAAAANRAREAVRAAWQEFTTAEAARETAGGR